MLLLFSFLEENSTSVNNFKVKWNSQETSNILQTKNENTMNDSDLHSCEENTNKENIWQIEIPIIGLIAPIEEGTTKEIMHEFVGHFEHTAVEQGNLDTLEVQQRIINSIGDSGYAAVDRDDQINMVNYEQVEDFCKSADEGKKDGVTV